MQIDTTSPLLKSFENLGALTENYGLYEIKPFKDWRGAGVWQDKTFTFRLCNSGEMLEVLQAGRGLEGDALFQQRRLEILSRAIWSIDGTSLVTEEEVIAYNKKNNTELTVHQFILNWLQNLEDLVLSRLDAIYTGLQVKQVRLLQRVYGCDSCGQTVREIQEGTHRILYSLSEIVCKECYPNIDKSLYDFPLEKEVVVEEEKIEEEPSAAQPSSPYKCPGCGQECDSNETYRTHIIECPEFSALSVQP